MNGYESSLIEMWKEDGISVVLKCRKAKKFTEGFDAFLNNCFACGGNLTAMLLTGIKKLYPEVWGAIPEKMGDKPFDCVCCVLALLGVEA